MQPRPNGSIRRRRGLTCLAMLLMSTWLLCGCAADISREEVAERDDKADGPTVYGRLDLSVDHVSTR